MSHSLHRYGTEENLKNDYTFYQMVIDGLPIDNRYSINFFDISGKQIRTDNHDRVHIVNYKLLRWGGKRPPGGFSSRLT